MKSSYYNAVVQLVSHVQLFVTPWAAPLQAPLSFTISWSLLKFTPIESVLLQFLEPPIVSYEE